MLKQASQFFFAYKLVTNYSMDIIDILTFKRGMNCIICYTSWPGKILCMSDVWSGEVLHFQEKVRKIQENY